MRGMVLALCRGGGGGEMRRGRRESDGMEGEERTGRGQTLGTELLVVSWRSMLVAMVDATKSSRARNCSGRPTKDYNATSPCFVPTPHACRSSTCQPATQVLAVLYAELYIALHVDRVNHCTSLSTRLTFQYACSSFLVYVFTGWKCL